MATKNYNIRFRNGKADEDRAWEHLHVEIAECERADEAAATARTAQILVMDIDMGDYMDGIEASQSGKCLRLPLRAGIILP